MNFDTISDKIRSNMEMIVSEMIESNTSNRMKWNLDKRSMPNLFWFDEECLIVDGSTRNLDHSGGFEYVNADHRMTIGDFTVFSAESERVNNLLNSLMEGINDEDEDEDDEDDN